MLAIQKAMQLGLMNKEQASQMVFGRPAEGNLDDILTAYGKVENEQNFTQNEETDKKGVNTRQKQKVRQNAK